MPTELNYHSWELYDASGLSESEDGSDDGDAAAGRAGRGGNGGRGGGRGRGRGGRGGGGGGVVDASGAARTPQMPPTTLQVPTPMTPSRAATTTTTTTTVGASITRTEMHCTSLAAKLFALQRVVTATLLASMCSLQPSGRCISGTHRSRICCLISVSLR